MKFTLLSHIHASEDRISADGARNSRTTKGCPILKTQALEFLWDISFKFACQVKQAYRKLYFFHWKFYFRYLRFFKFYCIQITTLWFNLLSYIYICMQIGLSAEALYQFMTKALKAVHFQKRTLIAVFWSSTQRPNSWIKTSSMMWGCIFRAIFITIDEFKTHHFSFHSCHQKTAWNAFIWSAGY